MECPVCYSEFKSGITIPSSCSHKVCLSCYTNIILFTKQFSCPVCREKYEIYIHEPPKERYLNIMICGFRILRLKM